MGEDPNTVPNFMEIKMINFSVQYIAINPSVVFEKLTSLKCGKAPGPDGWLVEICQIIYVPLSILFIREWYSASRLENWSHNAHIQRGNKTKVNNYRPVCLTSIVIKVFESIKRDTSYV